MKSISEKKSYSLKYIHAIGTSSGIDLLKSSNVTQSGMNLLFCFIFHIYPPFTRKRIVSLYFGREVRTRLGVAFFEVYGPPVFHIKVGRPVKCLAQGHNKRTCRLVLYNLPINAERQEGKLRMPFFKVFWYDSTRGMNPRSTDCEADALTTTPSRRNLQKKVCTSQVCPYRVACVQGVKHLFEDATLQYCRNSLRILELSRMPRV